MKTRFAKNLLLILGTLLLVAGCESYDHRAASVDPQFPPPAATPDNDPGLVATGAAHQ